MQFLAGHIDRILSPVPQFYDSLQPSGFGVIGMSYGGAAAGEFCKIDSRCVAGSNLDGTQFGVNWQMPVQVPFLMMYSDASPQGNDYAYYPVASDFYEVHVRRSEHADFLDASYAFPIFKTLGVAGEIKREQMVAIVNELHLAFFNQYLKGGPHSMEQVALRFMDHLTMKVSAPKNDS